MTLQELTPIIAYLFAISVCAERVVEIIKNLLKLQTKIKDDRLRVVVYHVLSGISAIALSYISPPAVKAMPIYLIGFLASAGSGVWNNILSVLVEFKKSLAVPAK